MNIFRSEAIEHHNDTEYGDIILPTSFSLSVCATVTLFIMLSLTVFIYYGSYTRKAHLTGIVMPSSGLVKIIPQYAGYVTQLTVSEGEHVTAGTQLYHISGEHYNGNGTGTLATMSISLKTQYIMLASQQSFESRDNSQQQEAVRQRMVSLEPQIRSAEQRLQLAERQAELAISVME
ncbi:TPA: secretion protein HlyD, partial [Escherichia coli]